MATLFHFFISKRGAGRELPDAFPTLAVAVAAVAAAESSISISSTMVAVALLRLRWKKMRATKRREARYDLMIWNYRDVNYNYCQKSPDDPNPALSLLVAGSCGR